MISISHITLTQWYLPGLMAALALSLTLAAPVSAQPVTCNGLTATIVATTPGRIDGTAGVDIIVGTDGNDEIVGLGGNDTICAGAGDDVIVWNPGDGSDVVEGQAGIDTLLFNGSNASENITITPNGGRLLFFRDVANITMDTDDVERVTFAALGGADTITVNNLAGTDVTAVTLNLAGAGGAGDGAIDTVIVSGTAGNDTVTINGSAGALTVAGLSASVAISGAEGALDRLTVNGQAGDDVVDASGLAAGVLSLTIDGAAGDDELIGSAGDDTIFGGSDDDTLIGGPGNDTLDGGTGSNIIIQD